MLKGMYRKAAADLKSRPMQVTLLFLVIAASAMTLSLALNVQASASKPYERLREESNGADVWLGQLPEDYDGAKLESFDSVEEISGPFPISWLNYGIRQGERKQQVALVGMPSELPELDFPVVTKGRWLSAGGTREIVVDSGAAKLLKLKVGQEITLLAPHGEETFTVVGFAVPTGRVPAPISDPAFVYVLPETLKRIEPNPATSGSEEGYWYRTGVKLVDRNDTRTFLQEATAARMRFDLSRWQDVRENVKQANQFDVIFLNVFGVFSLLAAGLIVANAVGGQVLSQIRDIGILKTIGFTPRQVMASLLAQNLSLALAASFAGVLIGLLVTPFFLAKTADLLGVPAAASFNPTLLVITVVGVEAIVAVFTIVPAWRAGRIRAIDALNAGNDRVSSGKSRIAGLARRLRLPAVAVVGVKDVARRPARTGFTVLALVLAVVTATFSLGIEATLTKTMSDPTVIGGPPYDIVADRDAYADEAARAILDSHPDVESYLVVYNSDGTYRGMGFDLEGYEGDMNARRWAMREGRMPDRASEAAISILFASEYAVGVGDKITVDMFDRQGRVAVEVEIVGRYVDAEGRAMMVTRDTLPAGVEPSDYMIKTKAGTNHRAFANELIEASGGNLDPEILSETIADIRSEFRTVLVGLNAVLFFIAGVNLLSSLLLSIRERRRDIAILKTVGFTPAQVAQAVFWGSATLAVFAVAAGLPLGLVATRVMFDVLSSAAGIGTGVGVMPGVLWLAPLVPGAIALATLATVVPARRAAEVEVAEVLRYE
ncbi:MAG TPA: FtsX-like permease family protein [Dehalococcoidia bacterium]